MDEAPASEDASPAPVHVTHNLSWKWPGYGACNFVATSGVAAEPHNAVEEAISAEASPTEELYIIALEEDPLPEDTLPAEEAFSKEDPLGKEKLLPRRRWKLHKPSSSSKASTAQRNIRSTNMIVFQMTWTIPMNQR